MGVTISENTYAVEISDSQQSVTVSGGANEVVLTDADEAGDMRASTYDPQNVSADAFSHDNMTDIESDQHHSRYTDDEAQTAINNDVDHGQTAPHDFGIWN